MTTTDVLTGKTTRIRIPAAPLRWLEVNWLYLGALARSAPVMQAAAREYKQKFNRDLDRDIASLTKDAAQ